MLLLDTLYSPFAVQINGAVGTCVQLSSPERNKYMSLDLSKLPGKQDKEKCFERSVGWSIYGGYI